MPSGCHGGNRLGQGGGWGGLGGAVIQGGAGRSGRNWLGLDEVGAKEVVGSD